MKIMFASDIHGSFHYTQELLRLYKEEQADRLVLLGDLLYHGPRNALPRDYAPMKVAETLNTLRDEIIAVRGNCDSEVDQMVLNFPMQADYTQLVVENFSFFITHGHLYDLEDLPSLPKGSIYVFGHIHLPILKQKDDIVLFNPSSITLPKDNNPHTYGIYEEGKIVIKSLEGEIISSLSL